MPIVAMQSGELVTVGQTQAMWAAENNFTNWVTLQIMEIYVATSANLKRGHHKCK